MIDDTQKSFDDEEAIERILFKESFEIECNASNLQIENQKRIDYFLRDVCESKL